MINLHNSDCMEAMAKMGDNEFDLAIVDPPYGIDMDGGKIGGDNLGQATNYMQKNWDKEAPDEEYFNEIIRISKNQVIWGANHFISKIAIDSPCWIVWDKQNSGNFADCELAWTSFKTAVRQFIFRWNGMLQGDMKNKEQRIHPTQKPVKLYEWLLKNYAKEGDKILDTHLGSGSIALACHNTGFDLEGYEIDKDYYEGACKRLEKHQDQGMLFKPGEI